MERVSGIGGVFFRATDPEGLARWYADHLGVAGPPTSYEQEEWWQERGPTYFLPYPSGAPPLGDSQQPFVFTFRVRDLDAMAAQLRAAGIEVTDEPEVYPHGRFARIIDPEGNPVELWQPIGRSAGQILPDVVVELFDHVERFNTGVRTGDFGNMVEAFAPTGELRYEGLPLAPLRGRGAIAAAFAAQPPSDEMLLTGEPVLLDGEAGVVSAPFAWRHAHAIHAGELRLAMDSYRSISCLVVSLGAMGPAVVQPDDGGAVDEVAVAAAVAPRIFLVDESAAVRAGLAEMLRVVGEVDVVGSEAPGAATVDKVVAVSPDVVVLNVGSDRSGIDRCARIHHASPAIRCVLLTANLTDEIVAAGTAAGAHAVLAKQLRAHEMVGAVLGAA